MGQQRPQQQSQNQRASKYHCLVCNYNWNPRSEKMPEPKRCPRCHSERWRVGRARPPIAEQRAKAKERREKIARLEQLETHLESVGSVSHPVPVVGQVWVNEGYRIEPLEGVYARPPRRVKARPGDYCLLLNGDPRDAIIKKRVKNNELLLIRPDIDYYGKVAHIIDTGKMEGESGSHGELQLVTVLESGEAVLLEPNDVTLRTDEIRVRGVLRDQWQSRELAHEMEAA
jgi:hypothetical protein